MITAVPDCLVHGYEDLIESLTLPDAEDRHVLAAAIRSGAEVIVTVNLADFPAETLVRYQIEAKHPDDFVVEHVDSAPATVLAVVTRQAADLRSPPRSVPELLDTLQSVGLPMSVARLRELFGAWRALTLRPAHHPVRRLRAAVRRARGRLHLVRRPARGVRGSAAEAGLPVLTLRRVSLGKVKGELLG